MSDAYPSKPIPRVGNDEDTEVSAPNLEVSLSSPQVISSLVVRADPRRKVREKEREGRGREKGRGRSETTADVTQLDREKRG